MTPADPAVATAGRTSNQLAAMFAGAAPTLTGTRAAVPAAEIKSIPASSSLAIPTRHVQAAVAGVETHVVCQLFTDRLVVLISQVGKVGTLVRFRAARIACVQRH